MTEGEVRPDETELARNGPLRAVQQPEAHPVGPRCGSWFPDLARSSIHLEFHLERRGAFKS